MKETYTICALLVMSAFIAIGGPSAAYLHASIFGWDSGVYNAGIACFPLGFLAMGMTAILNEMVEARTRREHMERMNKRDTFVVPF